MIKERDFLRHFPYPNHAKVALLLFAVVLVATGWTDLDWMLVENHFQMWNATKDTWEFCPYLTMNWWLAYQFSILRLFVGWLLLGFLSYDLLREKKNVAYDSLAIDERDRLPFHVISTVGLPSLFFKES